MAESIITAIGGPIAKRFGGKAVGGAALFWAVGLAAYLLRYGPRRCPPARGAPPGTALWCQTTGLGTFGIALAASLCVAVVLGSALVVGALASRITNLVAGVGWPATGIGFRLTTVRTRAHANQRDRLAAEPTNSSSAIETAIHRRLYRYATAEVAPTRVGNALAAMSERIADRHGLRLSTCWQPLMVLLPDAARAQLSERSGTLLSRAQALVWSLASVVWLVLWPPSWWIWWVIGVGAAGVMSYLGLCYAAEEYADLVEGMIVANRSLLYRAVGVQPPASTSAEPELGRQLSRYLAGGRVDLPLHWHNERSQAEV